MPRARTVTAATRTEPSVARGGRRHGARLLVVDDDPDVRLVTAEMLRASGYAVEWLAILDEALAILEEDAGFDALLVHYVMPGMDGMALTQHLREETACASSASHDWLRGAARQRGGRYARHHPQAF